MIGLEAPNKIWVDRSKSGYTAFNGAFPELKSVETDYDIAHGLYYSINVLIDRSSVEAYFFDGIYSMTNLVFPSVTNKGVEIWINDENEIEVQSIVINVLEKSMTG